MIIFVGMGFVASMGLRQMDVYIQVVVMGFNAVIPFNKILDFRNNILLIPF